MKEKRYINEIRSVEGESSRHIVGYALLFNVRSVQLGDFTEVIMPEALNDEILKRSDVLALLNHDISRGVLARSRNGEGSLTLTIDEKGLRYEFDAPNTALGDELVEGIKRGDIRNSSFSFLVKRDEWQQTPEGGYLRIIHEFDQLFDISPVYQPAYDETSVDCRGLDRFKEEIERRMNEDNKDKEEKEEDVKPQSEEPQTKEPEAEEEKPAEGEEEKKSCQSGDESEKREDDEPEDNEKENEPAEQPADETGEDDVKEDEPQDKEENRNNIAMKKQNFSLLKAIRSVVNGEQFDKNTAAVIAEGRSIMSAANQAVNGQIVIPVESRAEGDTTPTTPANGIMATVATAGMENVAEDKLDIVEPLRNRSALGVAGATFLTGLVGDLSIPVYSGSNCAWKGEVVTAENGAGTFSEVSLKPKRLTAFIDISKQFIYQDSNSAEEMLRRDLVNAIAEKLEMTILGSEAGTTTKPEGLFNGVTADTAAVKFGDIVDWEADLENANIGEIKYIVNPSAKAILRKTAKDTGSGLFVMADGEIEGNEVISSASVVKKGVILGDFRELVIGQWGALDVVVDPYTKAADGQIRVVVNAYFDAALRRPSAVVKHILK